MRYRSGLHGFVLSGRRNFELQESFAFVYYLSASNQDCMNSKPRNSLTNQLHCSWIDSGNALQRFSRALSKPEPISRQKKKIKACRKCCSSRRMQYCRVEEKQARAQDPRCCSNSRICSSCHRIDLSDYWPTLSEINEIKEGFPRRGR